MNICVIGLGYVGFPLAELCVNHSAFKDLDFDKIKILIDGKNMFYGQKFNFTYKGVGR
jgi:UDP-N-acetyl-D-mannosaminuronate dehydrogenase